MLVLLLQDGLETCRQFQRVKDVRVKGAIGVVELDCIDDVAALRTRLVGEGVFLRPFGNVVYLTPAFTIAPNDLEKLMGAIVKVIRSL